MSSGIYSNVPMITVTVHVSHSHILASSSRN